ncbi:GFA family protein [Paracoccus sp. p3-h83]|uniref:GFA family protein n=1 Tax=Paracoccus sp. p3-h83 TaxID=3342805 RepID=UPI0035B89273
MTRSARSDFAGQCLCGAIRFSGRILHHDLRACHCSQCRRWSGHVWAAFTGADLRIEDASSLRWFASSDRAERGFCAACGSSLFWRRLGADQVDVATGALDAPTGLRLIGHIFTKDKGDYYAISDGLPQEAQE